MEELFDDTEPEIPTLSRPISPDRLEANPLCEPGTAKDPNAVAEHHGRKVNHNLVDQALLKALHRLRSR